MSKWSGRLSWLQQRPYLLFLPFLFLYSTIVIVFAKDELTVDEPSYLAFARNLLHGYYSPPPPDIDLWHAPGYPIIIAPLVGMGAPLLVIRLLNAVLLYCSILLFYRLLKNMVADKWALIASVIAGCYWLAWKGLPVIMTETFVFFLVTASCYMAWKCFREPRLITRNGILLSLLLAWLALTRFMFGYVLPAAGLVYLLWWIIRRKWVYKKAAVVLGMALLFTVPYLAYTWSLTGRIFYWGNAGGSSLYWMSNPAEGEYGDWFNENLELNESLDGNFPGARQLLEANHRAVINESLQYTGVAKDDFFKRKALEQIQQHPVKFFNNWLANIGRLVFNYPYSYRRQGLATYLNMVPHMFLVVLSLLLLPVTVMMWKQIPFFMKFLLLVAGIYFAGSTLLSATIRMFYILFPVWGTWIVYAGMHTIRVRLSKD